MVKKPIRGRDPIMWFALIGHTPKGVWVAQAIIHVMGFLRRNER